MFILYKDLTIDCKPEEFKQLLDIGAFSDNSEQEVKFSTPAPKNLSKNKDWPPYLDLPKSKYPVHHDFHT